MRFQAMYLLIPLVMAAAGGVVFQSCGKDKDDDDSDSSDCSDAGLTLAPGKSGPPGGGAAPVGGEGGCGGAPKSGGPGGGDGVDTTTVNGACVLIENTTATASVTNGCALITRDTSSCKATREAAGLTGAWLDFSCRVTLTKTTVDGKEYVQIVADSQPDYKSNYFVNTSACYEAYTPASPNPNTVDAQSINMSVLATPDTAGGSQSMGVVGIAVNGVAIFNNQAAGDDDIFEEADTFDECGGHPNQTGVYHYHTEPYAISQSDSNLIGVIRDGYFVYGRNDADGSTPADLDANGGHSGTTPHSNGAAVYHYHANAQTAPGSSSKAGTVQYFLTTGTYKGTAQTCTGC